LPEGRSNGSTGLDLLRRRARSRRVVVRDESMRPELAPGDRLWVDPRPGRSFVRGDIVVLRDPETPGRFLVKRVVGLAGDRPGPGATLPEGTVYLEGDNPDRSRDSRAFGPVPLAAVLGLAWFRYAPAARRRALTTKFK
jgi:signal peptidase I